MSETLEAPELTPAAPLDQLRFLTCGSVDDGKSTLIGRLLYDTRQIQDDQMLQLQRDSLRHGTNGAEMDFALLLDGLEAERAQGITIDVAYRFFATPRRRFIVADTPGHEQYTRNMATGASTADLAVLIIDARRGIRTQTRRHAFIAGLMGIRHLVLAVNKIDLVDFAEDRFNAIVAEFRDSAEGFHSVQAIPLSARHGDNMIEPSPRTPWYVGPTLLEHLETVEVSDGNLDRPFRMPVQMVTRPDADFRGYAGTIASGRVQEGDMLRVQPSGRAAQVTRIVTMDGDLPEARAGTAVTLVLDREVDISRGDLLAADGHPAPTASVVAAHLVWLSDTPLKRGQSCLVKLGTRLTPATVTIRHRVDMDTREHIPAEALAQNEIGVVEITLQSPVMFEPYATSRELGGIIIIDRQTNATIGVGMIDTAVRRATDVVWEDLDVDRAARAAAKHQRSGVLWFTGLSGSGKSTIANLVDRHLHTLGHHTYILDGDRLRHGLNGDLGFTAADRAENVRRIGHVAALMADAGLIVLVSTISPYKADREQARQAAGADAFVEIFVDTPVAECRLRDPKGLYVKADAGTVPAFTGVSAPYEEPDAPDLRLLTLDQDAEKLAQDVVNAIRSLGWIL